jgi:hypothetical protein
MKRRCPFCLDADVAPVGPIAVDGRRCAALLLMECPDCEKWYVAESGAEIPSLCATCTTPRTDPGRCYPEVRAAAGSTGAGIPRRRLSEFNHLCGGCPHRHFVAPGRDIHASA